VTISSEARVQLEVDRLVQRTGARAGYLIADSGMVSAQAGDPSEIEVATVVSLLAAQTSAAAALATLVCGREFSEFVQEGASSSVRVTGVGGRWILALLVDGPTGILNRLDRSDDHVRGLEAAIGALAPGASGAGTGSGVGSPWADEAESRIDRLFREES
jgi:hypothetical protein